MILFIWSLIVFFSFFKLCYHCSLPFDSRWHKSEEAIAVHVIQQFYIWISLDFLGECHLVILICFNTYCKAILKFSNQCQSFRASEVNQVCWIKKGPFMTIFVSHERFFPHLNPHGIINCMFLPLKPEKCTVAHGCENQVSISHIPVKQHPPHTSERKNKGKRSIQFYLELLRK